VRLTIHQEGPTAVVRAEESGLRAATLNLVLNAIEAAGRGGDVQLAVLVHDDMATIEVTDTGPGPPPHLTDTLFEPFTTSKPEGVGLGLALTQQVASEHGGSLRWERNAGQTRFALTLPLVDADLPDTP
jgi:signal transduction histidine kinase